MVNLAYPSQRLQLYLLSSLFAGLTAVGASIRIPLPVVPITLQTFFVMLAGALLGAHFGALSQVIYLAVGLLGAPVFSQGGGPGYVFQPTFGYLVAYPIAAFVIGSLLARRTHERAFWNSCAVFAVGVLIILLLGATVLYCNLKWVAGKPVSFETLVVSYFLIFIPGDLIKIILAALVSIKLQRVFKLSNATQ
jgi:biotin transport system substrate-specific component